MRPAPVLILCCCTLLLAAGAPVGARGAAQSGIGLGTGVALRTGPATQGLLAAVDAQLALGEAWSVAAGIQTAYERVQNDARADAARVTSGTLALRYWWGRQYFGLAAVRHERRLVGDEAAGGAGAGVQWGWEGEGAFFGHYQLDFADLADSEGDTTRVNSLQLVLGYRFK